MAQKVRELWAKISEKYITEKMMFIVFLAIFVVVLIPMLIIAFYTVPIVDDFGFGVATHHVWEQNHSVVELLRVSFQGAVETYFTLQGLVVSSFLGGLQPGIFGEQWYFLTAYMMLISLLGGGFYFIDTVFHRIAGMSKYQAGIVWIVFSIAATQLLPSAVDAFYWYDGAMAYTFAFGLSLILYAKIALLLFGGNNEKAGTAKQVFDVLITVILSIVAGLTNFVTGLTTAILYVLAIVGMLWLKPKDKVGIVIPCAVFFMAFAVSVVAPGNAVRGSIMPDRSAVLAIWHSFNYALEYAQDWFTPLLFCLLAFLLPLFWYALENSDFSFPYPAMVTFGSFCFFSAMFCPHLYALGIPGPSRYLNVLFYAFVILLIGNEFYILGYIRNWLIKRGEIRAKAGKEACYSLKLVICFAFAAACAFVFTCRNIRITSFCAATELLNGSASAYYEVNQARLALLKDESKKDVVLPRYQGEMPYTIFMKNFIGDIGEGPEDTEYWKNELMAAYYGKDSVILEPVDP